MTRIRQSGPLPFSDASARNRAPIRNGLAPRLPPSGRVLEIGAGSGQHAVFLAAAFPQLQWLPTERADQLPGLQARLDAEGGPNILPARALDVTVGPWPRGPFEAAFTANTAHIMPWEAVCDMLDGVAARLAPGAAFFIYGAFNVGGEFTAPSNRQFDANLRAMDPAMGVRDVEALESRAGRRQMVLEECIPMPSHNFLLVFRKTIEATR